MGLFSNLFFNCQVQKTEIKMANFYINTEKRKDKVRKYDWKNICFYIGCFFLFLIAIGGFYSVLFLDDKILGSVPENTTQTTTRKYTTVFDFDSLYKLYTTTGTTKSNTESRN